MTGLPGPPGKDGEPGTKGKLYDLTHNCIILCGCFRFVDAVTFNKLVTVQLLQWRSWLRHCARSWKVAGSIPDGVTGIF